METYFLDQNNPQGNETHPQRDPALKPLAAQANSVDQIHLIEELRMAREIARENELRYRHLFDNAPLCIFEVELENFAVIRSANHRAEAVYGWTITEFMHLRPEQLIPENARGEVHRMISRVRKGETAAIETTNQRKDGTVFPVRMIATPEIGPHTNHIVVTVEDITAQKQRRSEAEAIDEERRRIAQEIHDGIAQNLAALRLKIPLWHAWADNQPETLHAELDQMKHMLDETIDEIRRSIYALRPVALDEAGFFQAARLYIQDFNNQFPVYIEFHVSGPEERLPVSLELPFFRILQEALNNIARHAQASLAKIELDLNAGNCFQLIVRDNGRGFAIGDLAETVRAGHLGLKQMRERVEKLGGRFQIESQPGFGTTLQITVPSGSGQ